MESQQETDRSLIEQIADMDNLLRAWVKVLNAARRRDLYFDQYSFSSYERNLKANLTLLRHHLLNGQYQVAQFRAVDVPKNGETRTVFIVPPEDRVVIQAIINVIGPVFERDFSPNSYGHRLDIAETDSNEAFQRWQDSYLRYSEKIRSFFGAPAGSWYEKTDIKSFYPNVDLNRLLAIFANKISNDKVLALIDQFLNWRAVQEDGTEVRCAGLPTGTDYAHFFANVYLDNFDKAIERQTAGYVRYVDDICFVCESEAGRQATHRFMEEQLESLGLSLNYEKTEIHPISEPGPLIDQLQETKYDLNLMCGRSLTEEAKEQAAALFMDIFFDVEEEDDLADVARHIGYALPRLVLLGSGDVEDIAYTMLDAVPLKANTLRILVGCLAQIALPDHADRLATFLRDANTFVKMAFAQMVGVQDTSGQSVVISTLLDFLHDDSYLVRAAALVALKQIGYRFEIGHLRQLLHDDSSAFVRARALSCIPLTDVESPLPDLLSALHSENPPMIGSVLRVLNELASDALSRPIVAEMDSVEVPRFAIAELIFLCLSLASAESLRALDKHTEDIEPSLRDELVEIVAQEVYPLLAARGLENLFSLANALRYYGSAQAVFAYHEIVRRTDDGRLRELARQRRDQALGQVREAQQLLSLEDGRLVFNRRYEIIMDVKKLSQVPGYTCHRVYDPVTKQEGVLELIDVEKLVASPMLSGTQDWLECLRQAERHGMIDLIEAGQTPDPSRPMVFAVYAISQGYGLLDEQLAAGKFEGDDEATLKLVLGLTTQLQKLSDIYLFQSVHGHTVLVNQEGGIKFVALGSGFGVPIYVSSHSPRKYQEEISPHAFTYFLGLIALEAFAHICPLSALDEVRQDRNVAVISKSRFLSDASAHFKSLLKRALSNTPQYRYPDFTPLQEDSTHILNYLSLAKSLQESTTEDLREKLEFVDYAVLRSNVARRNPTYFDLPMPTRAGKILEGLSDDLAEFQLDKETNLLAKRISLTGNELRYPGIRVLFWLTPASCQLLDAAINWDKFVGEVEGKLNQSYPKDLAYLFLSDLLHAELLTALHSAMTWAALGPEEGCSLLVDQQSKLLELQPSRFNELSLVYDLNRNGTHRIANPFSQAHIEAAHDCSSVLDNGQAAWLPLLPNLDFRAISALLLTIAAPVAFVNPSGEPVARFRPLVPDRNALHRPMGIWALARDVVEFEKLMARVVRPSRLELGESGERVWELARRILAVAKRLNLAKRKRARIACSSFYKREGVVKIRQGLRIVERTFSRETALVLGDTFVARGSRRSAKVDILAAKGQSHEIGVYGRRRVLELNKDKTLKTKCLTKVAQVMTKLRWAIPMSVGLLTMVVMFILLSKLSRDPAFQIAPSLFSGIILGVFSNFLTKLLEHVIEYSLPGDWKESS